MKQKIYTLGVTIFITPEMYQQLKQESDSKNISNSEFIRRTIDHYFQTVVLNKECQL